MRYLIGLTCLALVLIPLPAAADDTATPLPDLGSTGVVVPWSDFKQLLDRLLTPATTPPAAQPPVDFAVSGCTISATATSDERQLQVEAAFTVQVLTDEHWVEIPVIGDGVALAAVTMDGEPARLYRSRGAHTVAVRGVGRHRFTLEYLVTVEETRGTRTARLAVPRAPAVTVELTVPRADVDLQIDGAVVRTTRRGTGETRMVAALARAGDTSLSWFKRVAAEDRTATVFGELATLVSIGEGALRGTATASYTIHGRGVDALRIAVPAAITVLEVHGAAAWRVEGDGDPRLLVAQLGYPATGSVTLSFDFELALAGASAALTLPDIALEDVLRERGFIAVAATTNVEITPAEGLTNAAPVDPAELPPTLTAAAGEAILYGFKFLRHPVSIPLEVVKHADVAVKRTIVETATLRTFATSDGKRLTAARYTVKNNRKQYLELTLPPGATLWGAFLEDQPVKAARRDDGALLVPLRKTATGRDGELRPFTVEVVYFEHGSALGSVGRCSYTAPILDVDALEINWQLFLPRDRRYLGGHGNLAEVPAATRLVVLGGAVYNLANPAEARLLQVVRRDDVVVLTDGANEVSVDALEVDSDGALRALAEHDLATIDAARQNAPGGIPAPAMKKIPIPDPTPEHPGKERREAAAWAQVQSSPTSNVAALVAGGNALGLLPVRFAIPAEGLQLSFNGRLLTAGEAPAVRLSHVPASWRLPRLPAAAAILFGGGLALLAGLLLTNDLALSPGRRQLAAAAALAGLVALYVGAVEHRLAFWLAVAAAATVVAVVRAVRDRRSSLAGGGA